MNFTNSPNITFNNNIGSHIHADYSFPPGLARGVTSIGQITTCNYTCMFDIFTPYYDSPPTDRAIPGTGAISTDPAYIDSPNNNYDLTSGSPAQAGDAAFIDWDDDGSGGNESRSRMGCHGGPGGETVGLLN